MYSIARRTGFTILEVLVAAAILAVLLIALLSTLGAAGAALQRTKGNIDAFQNARTGFERMVRQLSQATLNTYWSYDDTLRPTIYLRASDLHFLSGRNIVGNVPWSDGIFFQSPQTLLSPQDLKGMTELLSESGFFLEFSSDAAWKPSFLPAARESYRYRLVELAGESENLRVYESNDGSGDWVEEAVSDGEAFVIADNIIGLIFWPRLSVEEDSTGQLLGPTLAYNSRPPGAAGPVQPISAHQLPPLVEVVMVAIDEPSALKMEDGSDQPGQLPPLFQGLFEQSGMDNFERDILELENRLNGVQPKLNHRVFRATVALKEAKWNR